MTTLMKIDLLILNDIFSLSGTAFFRNVMDNEKIRRPCHE